MEKVEYTIRRSRKTKRMRLDIYYDGSVFVTAPYRKRKSSIEKFIERKKKWLIHQLSLISSVDRRAIHSVSKKRYLAYKDEALQLVNQRIAHYNEIYKFPYKKISVRNQKSRWGSCSIDGCINLNYKIIFLPEAQRDYIIVHELCHLKELNHSPNFWSLVSQTTPNYKALRKSLANI